MKKKTPVVLFFILFVLVALLVTFSSLAENTNNNVVAGKFSYEKYIIVTTEPPILTITTEEVKTPAPTKVATTTAISTMLPLPYTECPENGKEIICFGYYYKELPSTAWDNNNIVPEYIILHWDGRPAGNTHRWISENTWHGLANREDGGKSSHFAVGMDGVGQFLPMYKDTVKQSKAASYYMDPHCINIEMAGRDFDGIVTGEADKETQVAIETITAHTLELVINLMKQYNIPIENILGHYQVLEGKIDPGELWLQEYFLPQLKSRLDN